MKGGVFLWTKNELKMLSEIDIRNINPDELLEISELNISSTLPIEQKMELLSHFLKNPYCYKVNGVPVQISFTNHNQKLSDCLSNYFINKINSEYDKL